MRRRYGPRDRLGPEYLVLPREVEKHRVLAQREFSPRLFLRRDAFHMRTSFNDLAEGIEAIEQGRRVVDEETHLDDLPIFRCDVFIAEEREVREDI